MPGGNSTLGVTPTDPVSSYAQLVYNSVFPSQKAATYVGGLAQDKTDLNVMSQLSQEVPDDYFNFNFESGSALKLAVNNLTNTSTLRVQLLDTVGNVVADSQGTDTQKNAYYSLISSNGLAAANGSYTVHVSYTDDPLILSGKIVSQAYSFQLYSGTTYDNSIITTAQTQPYDPNLFVSASNSVTPSPNLTLYTQTAALPTSAKPDNALNIGDLVSNQTELDAVGQITNAYSADYYSFNFKQGSTIKLAVDNTTNALVATQLRVQLLDSTGTKVLADSQGTDDQKQAYIKLSSGVGLAAANGQYIVKVSGTPGQPINDTQDYNFQLLSGAAYNSVYKTTATLPGTSTASTNGVNVGVFASSDAQLYSRQDYNQIGATASAAVNIGWITENKSSLVVQSQLTQADSTDFYNFTFQKGSALKLSFTNTTNTSEARIQILDVSGSYVVADSKGTQAQQAAFNALTSATGLDTKPGQYTVKVSYAPGADKSKTQGYNFQLYSGSVYSSVYRTIASAQTYQNALLSGNTSLGNFSSNAAAALYLQNLSQGVQADLFQTISQFV